VACDLIAVLLGDTDDDPDDHEGGGSANDEVVNVVVLNDDASDTETSDTDTVYGTVPMAPESSSPTLKMKVSSRRANPRRRSSGRGGLARTVSWSTSKTTPPPVPMGSSSRSDDMSNVVVWPVRQFVRFVSAPFAVHQVGQGSQHWRRAERSGAFPGTYSSAEAEWVADYRATRSKVERKLGNLMWRKHGRRAHVRGTEKVGADSRFLAAAVNLARLGNLGASSISAGWTVAEA